MNIIFELYQNFKNWLEIRAELPISSEKVCINCGHKFQNKHPLPVHIECMKRYKSMSQKRKSKLAVRHHKTPSICEICKKPLPLNFSLKVTYDCPNCHFIYGKQN